MSGTHAADPDPSDVPTAAVEAPPGGKVDDPVFMGAALGRYVVLSELGRGGMGRVVRAYDPTLQREVALKLLHTGALSKRAADRMIVEARAMARLSHPHVVTVYDVEVLDESSMSDGSTPSVVIVMEYVEGQTLGQWTRSAKHPWRSVLDRYVDAARGLQAAHARGILHRDFKPSNVLVGRERTVKVTDFGLAKLGGAESDDSTPSLRAGPLPTEVEDVRTGADEILGTPRYMAPEQHLGNPVTEAADQYALCASLWEALLGAPPFPGRSNLERKLKGPPPWPDARRVPPRIADAIRRGLAPRADRRWPSLEDLIAQLDHDAAAARRRRRWSVVGLVGLSAGGIVLWQSRVIPEAPCRGARDHMGGVWDETLRSELTSAIQDTGVSYAPQLSRHVAGRLDEYADAWVQMHTETCEATSVRGEQSAEVMDLRMDCLRRAQQGLAAVSTVLIETDAAGLANAVDVVDTLPRLAPCAHVASLRTRSPLPSEADIAAVQGARTLLADVEARLAAGQFSVVEGLLEQAEQMLEETNYEPLQTELLIERGRLEASLGDYDAARQLLSQAERQAAHQQDWKTLYEAAAELLHVVGYQQERFDEALHDRELLEGIVLGLGDEELEADLANRLGTVLLVKGDIGPAQEQFRRSLARYGESSGLRRAAVLSNLASALSQAGQYQQSETEYRRAMQLLDGSLSAAHPTTIAMRSNVAVAMQKQGKHEAAAAEYREILQLREELLGADHPLVASARTNLGVALVELSRYDEAELHLRVALKIRQGRLGEDHPQLGQAISNVGLVLESRGDFAGAQREYLRALSLLDSALGSEHPNVAMVRINAADMQLAQGDASAAQSSYRTALEALEHRLGTDHSIVATARAGLARVLLARGGADAAELLAEEAWRRHQRADVPSTQRARTAMVLARALWATGTDRSRAVELATSAAATPEAFAAPAYRGEAPQDWLRAHADSPP